MINVDREKFTIKNFFKKSSNIENEILGEEKLSPASADKAVDVRRRDEFQKMAWFRVAHGVALKPSVKPYIVKGLSA